MAVLSVLGAHLLSLGAAPPGAAAEVAAPLADLFDNTAVTADRAPAAGDLDGRGGSLAESDLTAAGWARGARITVNGTTYTRAAVAPGRPDNVLAAGQEVAVTGRGSALGFLATATGGPATGTGTVHYSDGSSTSYRLTVGDWTAGSTAAAALTLPHRRTPSGTVAAGARLYAVAVPVDRARTVTAVTLPRPDGDHYDRAPVLHVFDLAIRNTTDAPGGRVWEAAWTAVTGSASAVPEPGGWTDRTLRMVAHPNLAGRTLRIRLTNALSPVPVTFGRVTVAVRAAGGSARAAPVPLTFAGQGRTTVPAGGDASSDPVDLPVAEGDELLVSIHLPGPVQLAPRHPWALSTSYTTASGAGDHSTDTDGAAFTGRISYWAYLAGVDLATADGRGTVVALGDSQTDGAHSSPDTDRRWPDLCAADLRRTAPGTGIANAGLSANSLLTDSTGAAGAAALNRLDRDVFAQPDARTLVLYEGINDITLHDATARAITAGLREIAARAHAHGVRVVVATIPPFGGSARWTREREEVRQRVNAWIRTSDDFDARTDFDRAARDPAAPERLREGIHDPRDHLHFNDTGTRLLADTLAPVLTAVLARGGPAGR
ncbi:GDSL-type esterase/lipase family protein [Streptomyces sp. NRRL B-24484]|uniref:GDSL-type esterase/lipase family protein n=1 Tax=Streptomyces sp. NRRL B-24484 TaxID=1463833 RepID=UPI000693C64D|nr:GDSL-type esterase/lipase family protein [Streptomyces sp. NRRL B-24484]